MSLTAPTEEQIAAARAALAAADPLLAKAHAAAPDFSWRPRPRGFEGLAIMVVEQQVSVAAARAIWSRFETGVGGAVTPAAVLAFDEAGLQAFGLSGQKARYVRAIAQEGALFDNLHAMGDDEAVAHLTAIKGVGRWTAETYLMFCEGRTDFLPAGDIALQEAVRLLDGAEARPTEKALYERARAWAPHRSVAALLLWSYYGAVKRREVVP